MYLLDKSLPTLPQNLALDEALLLDAEAGGPEVLRLWSWPTPAVVLGAAGRILDDVDIDACQANNVPIARRSSGGGTVLLGAGCLVFSVILRFERDPALEVLHASYRFILDRVLASVEPRGSCQGSSDLTLADRKFSGNAQQRKRTHLLHHGTLLYDFDPAPATRYLKAPVRQPEYRRRREHKEFLTNLSIGIETLKDKLREVWSASEAMPNWPEETVRQLVVEKYDRREWVWRR